MSIDQFLPESGSNSDDVKATTVAFDGSCKTLGLVERDDPLVEIVAAKITEVAMTGESDPARILRRALVSLPAMQQAKQTDRT